MARLRLMEHREFEHQSSASAKFLIESLCLMHERLAYRKRGRCYLFLHTSIDIKSRLDSAVYAEDSQYAHDDTTMEIRFNTENSRACIRRDIKEFPILIRYITTDIKILNDRNDQGFGISVIEYKGSVVEVVRGTIPADKPIMIWTAMCDEVTNPSICELSKGRARYCFAKGYTRWEDGTIQLVEPSILPKYYEGALKQVLQEQ